MTDENPTAWKYYDWSDTQSSRMIPDDAVGVGLVLLFIGLIPLLTTISGLYLIIRGLASRGINHLFKRNSSSAARHRRQ